MSGNAALLNCPVCYSDGSFSSIESLRNRLLHISKNNVLCPVCQEEINGLDNLIVHLHGHLSCQSSVSNSRATTCKSKDAQDISNSKLITKHENKMTRKIEQPFDNFTTYNSNGNCKMNKFEKNNKVNNGHKDTSVPLNASVEAITIKNGFVCNVCGLHFIDENILTMHLSLIHNIESSTIHTITNYQCHLCTKSFKMRGSLMVHFRVAHFGFLSGHSFTDTKIGIKNNMNGTASNENESIDNCQKGDNKQWKCDVCEKFFTTKYFLKKHKRLHTGETPYSCSQCNKTFTFQQSYHKHLQYHNDEKPHCCSVCGRAFKELSTLHNHQRIHTGEKPFACEICGKSFRQRVSYLVHKRIHTGAMPYKCTACEKSFRYKVSQRTHKCQVQPPGTVIRTTGELIEKLKKKKAVLSAETHQPYSNFQNETISYNDVSNIHAELVKTSAKLSFEDTESESFNLLGDATSDKDDRVVLHSVSLNHNDQMYVETNIDELIDAIPYIEENGAPSPSEILKNLCLSQDDIIL